MMVSAQWATHPGKVRDHNEDFVLADPDLGLYIVCDGMGGHESGEVASKTTAEAIHRIVRDNRATVDEFASGVASSQAILGLIQHAIGNASTEVFDLARRGPGHSGMGTTCTLALVCGPKVVMGHVGDSRLYLHRQGRVYQVSEDHTHLNDAIRRGMIKPEQAAGVAYGNVLSRAVGIQPGAQADTLVFDLVPGDTLLLCSDGLGGYFPDPQGLAPTLSAASLEGLPETLIQLANDRGGEDNIAAITIRSTIAGGMDNEHGQRVASHYRTLRKIELFSELHMADLARVLTAFTWHRVEPGEAIVREGEATDTLFVIVEGEAEVLRGQDRMAVLGPGSHFGEMALLSYRPRSATVKTTKRTEMLFTNRERFVAMLRQDSVMAAGILWRLAQSLSIRLDEVYELQDSPSTPVYARAKLTSPFDWRPPSSPPPAGS